MAILMFGYLIYARLGELMEQLQRIEQALYDEDED